MMKRSSRHVDLCSRRQVNQGQRLHCLELYVRSLYTLCGKDSIWLNNKSLHLKLKKKLQWKL